MKKRVIDFNAGLGGRIQAFLNCGFEIVNVYDSDEENCRYLSRLVGDNKVINTNIKDVNPLSVKDAEIYTFKYIQVSYAGRRYDDINMCFYKIVETKLPRYLLIEVPWGMVISRKNFIEEYMNKYQMLGYLFSYRVFDEALASGFNVKGKQAFFVGVKCEKNIIFEFPTINFDRKQEIWHEDAQNVDLWYRRLQFDTSDWKRGEMYIRTSAKIEKTDSIHMGASRELFYVDEIGARRLTHNELAITKGLNKLDYNKCINKRRMYNKISYASNVFIVTKIVDSIGQCICTEITEGKNEESKYNLTTNVKTNSKVMFPKITLKSIYIENLKGLKDVRITFDKRLVALMGMNGVGKSTVLHALACTYSKYDKGEDYKFSYFFTPNSDSDWSNSSITVTNYDENTAQELEKTYKKRGARWARYNTRPIRDIYYMGIDSCIPEIEKEKKTSFIKYKSSNKEGKIAQKILRDAAYILQKDYDQLVSNEAAKKNYIGVHTKSGTTYSSLSMGAGEQKILNMLQKVYNANQYSLILIDEIDLLLHIDALKKLIETLAKVAEEKKLQIIFTTHSLEMKNFEEYVDIKYIEQTMNKTLIYQSIKPELLYELSGESKKLFYIYVEDRFARAIVKKVLKDAHMLRFVGIIQFGAIENSVIIAASKVINGENLDNILIVTDGDLYTSDESRMKLLKSRWSGTEGVKEKQTKEALSIMTQFNLPEGMSPEEYVHSMLVELDLESEYIDCARKVVQSEEPHGWIWKIVEQMGDIDTTYIEIMNLISQNPKWEEYVSNVKTWVDKKREEIKP